MKKAFIVTMLALGVALVPSCSNLSNPYAVAANNAGAVSEVVEGTVVQANRIVISATNSDKNVGTAVGAAVGAGAGQLLGKGKGRLASTAGFGVVGALLGRSVGSAAGQNQGQELLIKADKGGRTYRIQQPIYEGIGEIPVGTHGYLTIGGSGNSFRPDGN